MKISTTCHNKQSLIEFLASTCSIDRSIVSRQISRGECRVDGKRCRHNITLLPAMSVSLFVPDSMIASNTSAVDNNGSNACDCVDSRRHTVVDSSNTVHNGNIDIHAITRYRDDNIIIVDKPQGIDIYQLEQYVQAVDPSASLAHRLDRNTAGLVILALGKDRLEDMIQILESGAIHKVYQARVCGRLESARRIELYLFKDAQKSLTIARDTPAKGYKKAITLVEPVAYNDIGYTEIEAQLITGRTHQIRVSLAHIGHCIVGDGKYGSNKDNRRFGYKYQQLKAIRLEFGRISGVMGYMSNMVVQTDKLP